jgi:hypothetical protein
VERTAKELERLRAIVSSLHVHFDVEQELELQGRARVRVGLIVHLWGVHAKGARALPGCPKSHGVVDALRPIAAFALDHDAGTLRIEIEPMRHALYDSRVVPGADEVGLPIRIGHGAGKTTPIDGRAEKFLKEVRARLKKLGAQER